MFKKFAAAALAVSISTGALAGEFKSADFLKWSKDGQISYINTSLTMAATISPPNQSKCITAYSNANVATGYADILRTMANHSNYHPTGVIAAVLEKTCGKFDIAQH